MDGSTPPGAFNQNIAARAPSPQTGQVLRITWIGLGINLLLAILKFTVGFLGHSKAVVADAVHSLSDMATDLAVIFGVRFWSAPADEEHPYGHWRIETMVTAVIGTALVIVALGIGYNALATVREVHLQQPGWIALTGVTASIVLKEALYHWTLAVARRTKSSALIANAWHHRSDALSSIPAFIAVAAAAVHPGLAFVDHVGALLVSLVILKVSWQILHPAVSELTDSGAPRKDREAIQSIAAGIAGVEDIHGLRTRKVGSGLFVDLHVLVNGDISVRQGHAIAGAVKAAILKNGPDVVDVFVHLEPHEPHPSQNSPVTGG